MTGSRLIGIVVAIAVLVGAAYFIFPGFRAKANELYDKHAGWNEEARRKDPVGFIDYSIGKLEANLTKFGEIRTELRSALEEIQGIRQKNAAYVAFAEKELGIIKAAYKEAVGGKGWPVTLAGKSYNTESDLKQQVEVFLKQKASYESSVAQLDGTIKNLEAKQSDIVVRITETKSNLDLLKNQRAIVKADTLTAETEKMMASVNEVIRLNEDAAAGISVRTIEEYKKDAAREPAANVATPKADEFLKS
jgi:hypothetical protein